MSKWKTVKLGEVCDVRDGTHESPEYIDEGYPLITSKNLINGRIDLSTINYISENDYAKINLRSNVDNGDIIMPMIGTIGNPVIVEKSFDFAIKNVALIKFSLANDISNKYIVYLLKSTIFLNYIDKENRGGTQKFLSLKNIRDFSFPLPSLEEQKHIADILDKASNLIDLRKQQLEKMDLLIKSKFIDMLGDPVTNSKGWEVKSLKDIALGKLSYGAGASATEYDLNVRYIRITDINEKGCLNAFKVSPNEISDEYILREGDILFARSGATVGKTFRYSEKYGKCIYAGYLIRLVPNQKIVLPDYIYYLTKTDYYLSFVQQSMKTVAQPNINAQQYGALQIPIPPIFLQNQFAAFVEQVEKQKAVMQQCLEKMETNYKALMQEYFG